MSVAVLLSTFNGQDYIRDFLESLCRQTYKEFSLYVRDDGSQDSTLEIIKEYGSRLSIVTLDSRGNLGAPASFFSLLQAANGQFDQVFFADQDDVWNQDKIERAVASLADREAEPALYFSRLELVDHQLNSLCLSHPVRRVSFGAALVENSAIGCTVALNRVASNLICSALPQRVFHDWWVFLVCTALGSVFYDPVPTVKYRQHTANFVGAPASSFDHYVRRVKRFLRRDSAGVFGVCAQAMMLRQCFGDSLSSQQLRLIDDLIDGKHSLRIRMQRLVLSPLMRQRPLDTVILRFLFLINRY